MKAKDRRKIERQGEGIRREMGLPALDVRKLMATNSTFKNAILSAAAEQANRKPNREKGAES